MSAAAVTLPESAGIAPLDRELETEHGGRIESGHVAFEVQGPPDAPVVVVLGGISAGRHVASTPDDPTPGWWEAQVGPGRALDTARWRVVGLDYLGGPGGSVSHETRHPPGPLPALSPRDQARAVLAVLDTLGVQTAEAVVGASYGGAVALAVGETAPERVRRLAVLSAAHRSHPMATALRSIQRRILRLAGRHGNGRAGVELARAVAMTTYRTAEEFDRRFRGGPTFGEDGLRFPVDGYLDAHGDRFAERFGPDAFLALSESLDLCALEPDAIRVPTELLAVREDTLVPLWLVEELADGLAGPVRLTRVSSRYGHDAFLKEEARVASFLRRALEAEGRNGAPDATPAEPDDGPAGEPEPRRRPATAAARAAIATDREHGAVVPPIHLSSTYTFEGLGAPRRYDYTRSGNPTRDQLGEALAEAEEGAGAVVTSSGMAAISTVLQLLEPGDVLVAPRDCYGGTHRLLTSWARKGRFELHLAELWTEAGLAEALALRPALLWVETPSNPLLRITDIRAAVRGARRVGARVVVDNTFLSPVLQRPLALGADLVVHSTTKYLNGHSDVVGGAVVARDPALHEEVGWWANCLGVTGAPFDAWLTLRGLRTLHTRMRAHAENASAVVDVLERHPAVDRVHYPGLPDHPGREVAAAQQDGFGAMVSFELGSPDRVADFVDGLRHFSLAESLGGVESLVAHPASMTHLSMDAEARRAAGIGDGLLRLSVGIEDAHDLVDDLRAALDRASGGAGRTAPPEASATPGGASSVRRRAVRSRP